MPDYIAKVAIYVLIFLFGSSIGSFLNVVAYRVPRRISLVVPRSSCPHCGTPISAASLLPVLGYFIARGRCQHCKEKISILYPSVELFTGLVTVFLFQHYLSYETLIFYLANDRVPIGRYYYANLIPFFTGLWLAYTGIALSLIDFEHRILPDRITLPGIVVGIAIGTATPEMGIGASFVGAFVGAGILWGVAKLYEVLRGREGLGFGDVKYLAMVGAVLGWKGVIYVIATSSILGTLVGLCMGLVQRQGLGIVIPFGPFIAAAAFIVHVYGKYIEILFQGG